MKFTRAAQSRIGAVAELHARANPLVTKAELLCLAANLSRA